MQQLWYHERTKSYVGVKDISFFQVGVFRICFAQGVMRGNLELYPFRTSLEIFYMSICCAGKTQPVSFVYDLFIYWTQRLCLDKVSVTLRNG